jgi:hypothetical protein
VVICILVLSQVRPGGDHCIIRCQHDVGDKVTYHGCYIG